MASPERRYDPEFEGEKWKHPYVWYVVLVVALSGFLLLMGWLAWTNGWIPQR